MTPERHLTLRRGADVHATDGTYGTLADVVIDPLGPTLTHVVVSPSGDHQLRRLVPLWLVSPDGPDIRVQLDRKYIGELQRVLGADFISAPVPAIETEHEIRFSTALLHPYFPDPATVGDPTGVPRDRFEVRRGSDVVSVNDHHLGEVVAFHVAGDVVTSMIVRSGLPGFRENVVVPVRSIAAVHPDMVELDLDRDQFRELPTTDVTAAGDAVTDTDQLRTMARSVGLRGRAVERLTELRGSRAATMAVLLRNRARSAPRSRLSRRGDNGPAHG